MHTVALTRQIAYGVAALITIFSGKYNSKEDAVKVACSFQNIQRVLAGKVQDNLDWIATRAGY